MQAIVSITALSPATLATEASFLLRSLEGLDKHVMPCMTLRWDWLFEPYMRPPFSIQTLGILVLAMNRLQTSRLRCQYERVFIVTRSAPFRSLTLERPYRGLKRLGKLYGKHRIKANDVMIAI